MPDAIYSPADVPLGPLASLLGIELVRVSADELEATMPVEGNTQPFGLLHGGASVVLAETLGSIGATLAAGPGRMAVGLDITATHHRSVSAGRVTGVARPISLGRTVACFEILITDEQGRRTCTARLTCLLRDLPPGMTRAPAPAS